MGEGARRISRSRRGLLELRVTLGLVWATDEDARAGTAAFERFCAATCFDESQKHWIVAHYDTNTRRRMWELEEDGAPPSCLNVPVSCSRAPSGLAGCTRCGTTRSRRSSSSTSRRRSARAAVATSRSVLGCNPAWIVVRKK